MQQPMDHLPYCHEYVSCYLCGADDTEDFLRVGDHYTGKPGLFRFVTCKQCGLVYQNPRLTLEEVKEFYDDNYVSHRKTSENLGPLTPLVRHAMGAQDRAKVRLAQHYAQLGPTSRVLDVGCAVGSFLLSLHDRCGCAVHGVDFKDLSHFPGFDRLHFHPGLFYEQDFQGLTFDLITMWHFLEHCYDPLRSLKTAGSLLRQGGRLLLEVPRLDSLTGKLFGSHWPGLQAPQHTMLLTERSLRALVDRAGLTLLDYRCHGSFPIYFYFFTGCAFSLLRGKGLDLRSMVGPYFLGQLATYPLMKVLAKANVAMQLAVCETRG
ncbi:MAG: hypothetical protein A2284_09235 [Deltaproteobacteria bacterium RIFOXYA12_FULL_61_11]|nr:MAG: hypothetical protein A2284_09235 [Deltaproteobacteria bacterium RIFOXYA12_FULL_61_11]